MRDDHPHCLCGDLYPVHPVFNQLSCPAFTKETMIYLFIGSLILIALLGAPLFTIIIAVVIYFIGHFTADARSYWLYSKGASVSKELKLLSQGVALIFPDFQLYNIIDSSIEGKSITSSIFNRLLVLTLFYSGIYSVLSWFTFRKKEF